MKKTFFYAFILVGFSLGIVSCSQDNSVGESPTGLSYATTNVFSVGNESLSMSPSVSGGAVTSYSVSPALPNGLSLDASTGIITGTPTIITSSQSYVVTATNSTGFSSCTLNIGVVATEPMLTIKFKFDPNQARLNNFGQPTVVASGNAAQSPTFNTISSHYVELAQTAYTQLGAGAVLYHAPETMAGGNKAIDFSQARIVAENATFLRIPLSHIAHGSYQWVRCSLSYQNYNIAVRTNNVDYMGTLASFVGFNTYVTSYTAAGHTFVENANKLQGYWGFAMSNPVYSTVGQAPPGATTVPNPLSATSPIPAGSCVVTGQFANNLVITGNETADMTMTLSLSINKSFEWHEIIADGKYDPNSGEYVVDMGLRGLLPSWQ